MLSLLRRFTFLLLWLTIFTVPWQKGLVIPGIGSINKVLGLSLVLVALFTVIYRGSFKKLPIFFILSFSFAFLNILSYFWAEVPSDAIDKSILFCQVIFLSWAIYEFSDVERQLNKLIKSYILGCTVIALYSIFQYSSGEVIANSTRFFVEGYNPNALGTLWVLALPMAVYLSMNGFKKYLLYIPIALFVIFLTGSRTAFILLVFVSICSLWLIFKYRVRFRKIITLSMIGVGWFVYSQIPQGQLDRISTIDNELSGGTLNGRTGIWSTGIEAFSEKPFWGVGSGSFLEVAAQYSITGVEMSAHNSYLSILVENGLIGFILFFIMITTLIISSYKIFGNRSAHWLGLTLILTWLILSVASHAEAQKHTWILFGFIVSLYYVIEKPKVINEKT